MATQFLVLPYRLGKRNKIEADQAQACKTEDEARRTGERMASRKHGIVVIKQDYDEQDDFADEAIVLATYGVVPEGWGEARRAA